MILTQSLISAFPCFPVFAFSLFFLPFLFSPSFLFLIFRYPYWSWDAANVPWQWPERGNRGAFKPLFSSSLPANITLTMKNTQTHTHTPRAHTHTQPECTCVCAHIHTHTQSRVPENCCQVAAAQETVEFLARARIDDCGQVIAAELTCVERSALRCEGWAQSL